MSNVQPILKHLSAQMVDSELYDDSVQFEEHSIAECEYALQSAVDQSPIGVSCHSNTGTDYVAHPFQTKAGRTLPLSLKNTFKPLPVGENLNLLEADSIADISGSEGSMVSNTNPEELQKIVKMLCEPQRGIDKNSKWWTYPAGPPLDNVGEESECEEFSDEDSTTQKTNNDLPEGYGRPVAAENLEDPMDPIIKHIQFNHFQKLRMHMTVMGDLERLANRFREAYEATKFK